MIDFRLVLLAYAVGAFTAVAGFAVAAPAAECQRGELRDFVTYIYDGDTVLVGNTPIRLAGLAAPEKREKGGPEATNAMRELVLGKLVTCQLNGEHSYQRCVGVCAVDGEDVGMTMIERGRARTCPRYAKGAQRQQYAEAEQRAAAGGASIGQTYELPRYCLVRSR